jgi:uncharacterized membrane protein
MLDKLLHYMFFCHKLPERSFFIKGKQLPICARCTGILVGYFLGVLWLITGISSNIFIELTLFLPLLIDGLGQYQRKWVSNNPRRFITGILAGIATILLLKLIISLGYTHGKILRALLNLP